MNRLAIILLTIISSNCFAQTKINVLKINDTKIKSILCSIDTVIFRSDNFISITIYKVANDSGSAHLQESDEISHKLIIAISSIDDSPEKKLFQINSFIYPKFLKLLHGENGKYQLFVEDGLINKRRITIVKISFSGVLI